MYCCDYRFIVVYIMFYFIRYYFKKIFILFKSVDIFCFKDLFYIYVIKKIMKVIWKIEILFYDKFIENLNGLVYILYIILCDIKIMFG